MPECKYCGNNNKLVDAHIIPESFFRDVDIDRSGLRIYSSKSSVYPKRAPIGIYDKNILCQECEKKFDTFDDYAARVLLQGELKREAIDDEEGNLGYYIHDLDYRRFKMFCISTLWRAAISKNEFFNYISLGKHFSQLDEMVKKLEPGLPNDFSVTICEELFPGNKVVMIKGYATRLFDGLRFYAIPMGRFILSIKVDQQNVDDINNNLILKPSAPLAVVKMHMKGSKHENIIREILQVGKTYRKSTTPVDQKI